MEGPRAAKLCELKGVEELANTVFRCYEGNTPTMFEEFPLLYSVDNIGNIRVIVEDGRVVANMNYLPQRVLSRDCVIPVASLGGVGTLQDYRGRGYGTLLLKDAVNRMCLEQELDILHISGDRDLYRRFGCFPAGRLHAFVMERPEEAVSQVPGIVLEQYSGYGFKEIVGMYKRESTRFVRSYDQFRILVKSGIFIDRLSKRKEIVLVKNRNIYAAYMIFIIEEREGSLVEYAGDRESLFKALPLCMKRYGLDFVKGYLTDLDSNALQSYTQDKVQLKEQRLDGTKKILNLKRLMERLKPSFYELYAESFLDGLEFIRSEDVICFKYKEQTCSLKGFEKHNDLVLGGRQMVSDDFLCTGDFEQFNHFFMSVFPIPFVCAKNLNYI